MPQDQDDIKGADAMKQAPTPGPLSASRVGTNSGHGHAWKRPDGVKSRCGGPGLCAPCSKDAALVADVVFAGKQSLVPAPVEASGSEREVAYDRLTNYPDYISDADGLARIRSGLLEVKDWHDLPGPVVNCNSLARLLDTIEMQRAQIAALRPQPSWSEEVQTADTTHSRRLFFGDPGSPQPSGETQEASLVVPLEPTEAMLRRGAQELAMTRQRVQTAEDSARDCWKAMTGTGRYSYVDDPDVQPFASGGQHSSGEVDRGRIEAIVRETVTAASVEVPERFADRAAMRFEITQNTTDAIVSALSDTTTAPVAETAGEAVAWIDPTDIDHLLEGNPLTTTLLPYETRDATKPLYAAPVPAQDDDKLRIAVEALKKAKDLDVSLLHDGYDSGAGGGNYVYADVVRAEELFPLLDQALAALKSTAAQEGGE